MATLQYFFLLEIEIQRKEVIVRNANSGVVVLDFETSGMSPDQGDRAIEIGAVLIQHGKISDRFQSLINPGIRINSQIEMHTGISNQMLQEAPAASEVMHDFSDFIADYPLVAHNATFDQRFLAAELQRIEKRSIQEFCCSLLLARRLYPAAPNHKLETLIRYKNLPAGTFHRAQADAEMTANLWLQMLADLNTDYGLYEISFLDMQKLAKLKTTAIDSFLKKLSRELGDSQTLLF